MFTISDLRVKELALQIYTHVHRLFTIEWKQRAYQQHRQTASTALEMS